MKNEKYVDPIEWEERKANQPPATYPNNSFVEPPVLVQQRKKIPTFVIVAVGIFLLFSVGFLALFINQSSKDEQDLTATEAPVNQESTTEESSNVIPQVTTPSEITTRTYSATSKNPAYTLTFSNQYNINDCLNASAGCSQMFGSYDDGPPVQIYLEQVGLGNTQRPSEDSQCDKSTLEISKPDKLLYFCEASLPGAGVLYYSFELKLGDTTHIGTFTGVNPRGRRFTDVSEYKNELTSIIDSIELAE